MWYLLTCSCLQGLSCPIVNPEIDFLSGSLVRFIYKVVPPAGPDLHQNCLTSKMVCWPPLPCYLTLVLRKVSEVERLLRLYVLLTI